MEELEDILTNQTKQQEIKDSAVWSDVSQLFIYSGYEIVVSGKTREILLKNMLKGIRTILRNN